MSVAERKRFYTPAEYYELEAKAEYKSDYYNGEIFPCGEVGPDGQLISMAGGSYRHSKICSNIIRKLGNRLEGSPCDVLESNVRLKVLATGLRAYPDVSVYCGQQEFDSEDPAGQTLVNPSILFEVLSPSTEAYDRGIKALHYRRIESLRLLVLVTQNKPQIEAYQREADGRWTALAFEGMETVLPMPSVGTELPLSEIYGKVNFLSDMQASSNS